MHRVRTVSVNSMSTIQTGKQNTSARISREVLFTVNKKYEPELFRISCVLSGAGTSRIDIELFNDLT
jgi:hypothetical protein